MSNDISKSVCFSVVIVNLTKNYKVKTLFLVTEIKQKYIYIIFTIIKRNNYEEKSKFWCKLEMLLENWVK